MVVNNGRAIALEFFRGDSCVMIVACVHLVPERFCARKFRCLKSIGQIAADSHVPVLCLGDFNFLHSDEVRYRHDLRETRDGNDLTGRRFEASLPMDRNLRGQVHSP